MKDLTKSDLYEEEKYDLNKYIKKRLIRSSEIDDKNREIDEWEEEQRADKTAVSMNIDNFKSPNDIESMARAEDMRGRFNSNTKSDYQYLVDDIQKSLDVKKAVRARPEMGSFGIGQGMMQQQTEKVSPNMYWQKFALWGRELNSLEDKEIKEEEEEKPKPRFGGGMFGRKDTGPTEKPAQKEARLKIETWSPYLFAGRISAIMLIFSIVSLVLKASILFTNPFILTVIFALSTAFISFKLNSDFGDGPMTGNFTFSEQKLNAFILEQEELAKAEKEEKKDEKPGFGGGGFGRGAFGGNRSSMMFDDDEDEDEYDDDEDEDEDEDEVVKRPISKPVSTIVAEENDFPKSWTSADEDLKEIYRVEERFLEYVWKERFNTNIRQPKDIIKFFAPIIMSFNKKFANVDKLDRGSWEFKNIAYSIGKYYGEIDKAFAKYNEHQKEYFFAIDEVTRTDLFYKVKLTLPVSVSPDAFEKSIGKFIDILKKNPEDEYVDAYVEMAGRSGYIKIMRINDHGFMPLVSTGDVLRFQGMKTTNNKDLLTELTSPGDLKILAGLKNAEQALVLDIGGKQNTNIAVVGFTGSGKTVSTSSWLVNILVTHSPEEVGFIIMDPKNGSAWTAFRYAPHVLGYFGQQDLAKWPAITNMLRDISTARQDYMRNTIREENYYEARKMFSEKGDWDAMMKVPRLFIVYDEMLDTLSGLNTLDAQRKAENKTLDKADKKFDTNKDIFKSSLGGLANVTREAGMTVMALSQRSDDNSIPRSYVASSSIKLGMKMQFVADSSRLFNIEVPGVVTLPTGAGYLMANGLNLSQINTPLFSGNPDYNLELIKIVGMAWSMLYSAKHDMRKIPQGFFLEKVHPDKSYKVENFSLFNRNEQYEKIKAELLKGDVHFKNVETDLSFDLDSKENLSKRKPAANVEETNIVEDDEEEDDNRNTNISMIDDEEDDGIEIDDALLSDLPDDEDTDYDEDDEDEENYDEDDEQESLIDYHNESIQSLLSSAPVVHQPENTNNNITNDENVTESHQDASNDVEKEKQLALQQEIERLQKQKAMLEQQINNQQTTQTQVVEQSKPVEQTIVQQEVPQPKPIIQQETKQTTQRQPSMFGQSVSTENKFMAVKEYMISNDITRVPAKQLERKFTKNMIDAAVRNSVIKKNINGDYMLIK